jgi:S-adenosylmethionine:tRNA ribosyltransferase-isomerase
MLRITDYTYDLPAHRIALHPLAQRDAAKLLVYRQGVIEHSTFRFIADYLPANATLFFNDTKVIRARLLFRKPTGAEIEIFLLAPVAPFTDMAQAMQVRAKSLWQCSIGNLKRWKEHDSLVLTRGKATLTARLINRINQTAELSWQPATLTLAEIIEAFGVVPLPPYINRAAQEADFERYQTVYSVHEGAVAAPTAGLHVTDDVLASLKKKNITTDFLTLHVSAGTFQPVKTEDALQHTMHSEQVVITRKNMLTLLQPNRFTVAVGTTSLRTLESLYWYGVNLMRNPEAEFFVSQSDPYRPHTELPLVQQALQAILATMDNRGSDTLTGTTSIYIYPGYTFKICRGLITNFHLPASTLILLVAAFTGNDWKRIYREALENNYRFLSYGDSSLLIP